MTYLDELNEVQRQAVECTDGPVMIVAGAGSGKTRVLTYRVAHLVNKGVDAFNILALTFTNKAAKEMKERIAKIVPGSEARNLWMGTFHSVFARILRVEAEKLGHYTSNFTIYDTDKSKSVIKDILKELSLDDKVYKPSVIHNKISGLKNGLINPEEYSQNNSYYEEDKMSGRPEFRRIYEKYWNYCRRYNAMDFDDILFNMHILLRDVRGMLDKYQAKFKYILVDEYQDTNFAQYLIVKLLSKKFRNICVVGDDAQSIYSFRGANIQNILNFEKDYDDLKVFKLEQNYRSTKTIVNAANKVIENNREQIKKIVWTDNSEGEKIKVIASKTDNEEGTEIANIIFEVKMNEQANNRDFAILYRTNAQSRAMEEGLRRINIPYRIFGGTSFYQRKEVKDLLAYFDLTINSNDGEALKRVINFPARGIGETTISKLMLAASDHGVSAWTVIENISDFGLGLNSGTMNKIADFAIMIKSFSAMLDNMSPYDLGEHIANASGILRDLYNDKTPEGVSRHENIQELLNGLKEFTEKGDDVIELPEFEEIKLEESNDGAEQLKMVSRPLSLADFMKDIALLTDSDKSENPEDRNRVSLMTIHAAKGLEFPYVYIVGLEENLFPSQMALSSRSDLEEERRLFYVALTRAEKKVTLSFAATRYRWGNLIFCEPSRFIKEIDSEYLDLPAPKPKTEVVEGFGIKKAFKKKEKEVQQKQVAPKNLVKISAANKNLNSVPGDDLKDLQVGMEVYHERFGNGKVIHMEGYFPNNKATVQFGGVAGQKQLLLKFAKLKILN